MSRRVSTTSGNGLIIGWPKSGSDGKLVYSVLLDNGKEEYFFETELKFKDMKKVNINVKSSYQCSWGNVEMPESVFNELDKLCDDGYSFDADDISPETSEWLLKHIHEDHAYEFSYEVEDLEESEDE